MGDVTFDSFKQGGVRRILLNTDSLSARGFIGKGAGIQYGRRNQQMGLDAGVDSQKQRLVKSLQIDCCCGTGKTLCALGVENDFDLAAGTRGKDLSSCRCIKTAAIFLDFLYFSGFSGTVDQPERVADQASLPDLTSVVGWALAENPADLVRM